MDEHKIIATPTSSNEQDDSSSASLYATQLATSSVLPCVLRATLELGVLEILEREGPDAMLSTSQIASRIPVKGADVVPDERHILLDLMLSLLASHSILKYSLQEGKGEDGDGGCRVYGLAPVAKYFIRGRDGGGSLREMMLLFQDKVMTEMWFHLKDAILERGVPFERTYGMHPMSYCEQDSRYYGIFKSAMVEYNKMFSARMLDTYKGFAGAKTLVDVGGGDGSILNMIISRHPHIKGVNFDLQSVIEKSPLYPGIEHIAGDMFVSIPKGDAIFIKWVLHMWNDEQCIKILKNCYDAVPDDGKVIVVDLVIPEAPEADHLVKSVYHMYMFRKSMNGKAKERTEKEWKTLARAAGFSGIQVASCGHSFSIVELHKNSDPCSA